MRRVGLRLMTAVRPLALGGGVGRWGVGGRCCWVGECTKHVAKEDRAIASECAEPKVHSSTSPAHPRALRACQRVVLAPSKPCWQQQQGD